MVRLLAVVFYGSAFLALALALARSIAPHRPLDPARHALAILNERLARGEIDQDEYLERRACLE